MRHNGRVTLFSDRHIGPDDPAVEHMLATVGHPSLAELVEAAVPASIRQDDVLVLPPAMSEQETLTALQSFAQLNKVQVSMIGQGYYDTVTPMVIRRNVLENPAWYTAYTPYQAEISQGRLEAMLNFQTMVSDLTALPVAGASLLDEATAVAEAMLLMRRAVRGKEGGVIILDAECLPQTVAVVAAQAEAIGLPMRVEELTDAWTAPDDLVGLVIQQPGNTGVVRDISAWIDATHAVDALVTVAADILSLCVIKAPGELGADIAVGSTQRFGVPLFFGGPHAAYMSVRDGLERQLPGRLVGVSVDAAGKPAYRLALQTREQHIRRDKATSNICTAQALLAIIASFYGMYHGPEGLREIALRVHMMAATLADALTARGAKIRHEAFFDTVVLDMPRGAESVVVRAAAQGINIRKLDDNSVAIACDELTTPEILTKLVSAVLGHPHERGVYTGPSVTIPLELRRTSEYLTHPIFTTHRSETSLMRYMRRLADRDLALDRTMIPLGSCTMKLNSAVEMAPVSWPGFAAIHPFAPSDQTAGYRAMIGQLEAWLANITGYAAVCVQPNAGSRGEYAGLLAIRSYHLSRGEAERDICLIPASAHGTNAASAVLAGMRVVVVATAADGEVDLGDLNAKIEANAGRVACIMITYPSTHGVYEEHVGQVCAAVHDAGGQVYIDGANLNALVGLAKPGHFGGDVSHLNLHKTFCIPHGGGGPGVGPIGVGEHLAPFLPNHPLAPVAGPPTGPGPVAGAPWGSAGVLAISWMYIRMMGAVGLRQATETAILNANYIATRLGEKFPVLYSGAEGFVAHECIIDTRTLKDDFGISVDDIAKRLIDYGFHAPTVSFPVAGTLMIEPTESESLAEIDRFCDAMAAIHAEARQVGAGDWPADDNPLVNAPHTVAELAADKWEHPYSRRVAAYPDEWHRDDKYWPPVGRIDGAYGDRNLVCTCPPISHFRDDVA